MGRVIGQETPCGAIKTVALRAFMSGLLAFLPAANIQAQTPPPPLLPPGSPQAAGQHVFATRCASCHGTNATGGEFAPSIVERVPLRTDEELVRLLHSGLPSSGMPPFPDIVDQDRTNLISFLRTLKPSSGAAIERASVTLEGGKTLQGTALNRSATDMQMLGDDHKLYLLRKIGVGRVPGGDVAGRLAELQRADGRQPLQRTDADHQRQCFPVTAQVDV